MLQQALAVMLRAITDSFTMLAVPAQNLKNWRVAEFLHFSVKAVAAFHVKLAAMFGSVVMNMVQRQKNLVVLAAAYAFVSVVLKDFIIQLPAPGFVPLTLLLSAIVAVLSIFRRFVLAADAAHAFGLGCFKPTFVLLLALGLALGTEFPAWGGRLATAA